MNKKSVQCMALVGALVLTGEAVQARRAPFGDEVKRACPCSKPKPKPPVAPTNVRSNTMEQSSCDTMRGCPCNKPKPKPPVRPSANMEMVESFRCASPMQQRSMLAMQVEEYMSNPCDEMAKTLMCCAQEYCERMQNKEMMMMVEELMCSDCKEKVQERIIRALGF